MKIFRYLKPYWFLVLMAPLTMIGEVLMDLFQPTLMSTIVDVGLGDAGVEVLAHDAPQAQQERHRQCQEDRDLQNQTAAQQRHHDRAQRARGKPDGHQRHRHGLRSDEDDHGRQPENCFPIHCDTSLLQPIGCTPTISENQQKVNCRKWSFWDIYAECFALYGINTENY